MSWRVALAAALMFAIGGASWQTAMAQQAAPIASGLPGEAAPLGNGLPAQFQPAAAPAPPPPAAAWNAPRADQRRGSIVASRFESAAGAALTREEVERIVADYLAAHSQEASSGVVPASSAEPLTEPASESTIVGSDLNFKARWNHGLEFETPAKDFRVHVGGRTQIDAGWFETDTAVENGLGGVGNIPDSVNFRRGRLRIDGLMWEVLEFAAEYDFVNEFNTDPLVPPAPNTVAPIPAMTELWITITHLPLVGNFRLGNMKDPISMEHLTSSRFLPLLERSFQFDAFVGGFNNGFVPGAMFFNWAENERMTWWAGVFKNTTNPFGFAVGGGEWNLEGRVTGLPYYEAEGRYLMHVGASLSQRDLDNEQQRFRSRGAVRNGPPGPLNAILADTGIVLCDDQQIVNLEWAAVYGSWTFQSEYLGTWAEDIFWPQSAPVDRGTAYFQGAYLQGFCFLTGEHQAYNRRTGVFDRVVPNENFFCVPGRGSRLCGTGAWQVGARYSFLDLNSSGVMGGILHGMTLGVNWFLNPNAKLQLNYDFTYRLSASGFSDGDIQALGLRMSMDF